MNAISCPICGKPAEPKTQPFCSVRCAEVDLGRWFTGSYRIASETQEEPEDEEYSDKQG